MFTDIRNFVRAFLHGLSTIREGRIFRPLGPYLFRSDAKDLLQLDHIELEPSWDAVKCIRMFRDNYLD